MKMKKADVAVAIYIMAAIIMFIVPIPSWLLDILLAINISVALTILFATMFSKEVLDMSFFPTMLLFTTIFRIALNTSSTRLILRDGNAGTALFQSPSPARYTDLRVCQAPHCSDKLCHMLPLCQYFDSAAVLPVQSFELILLSYPPSYAFSFSIL